MNNRYDVIVVGGGAAGFFGALNIVERHRSAKVLILEKNTQVLSKVRVSGGGRCNVTHRDLPIKQFAAHYPRGEKELRHLLEQFSARDTVDWFQSKGVRLKTEEDGRIFPESDQSQSIIDCFLDDARKKRITLLTSCAVTSIQKDGKGFNVSTSQGMFHADFVLACTGGSPNALHYQWVQPVSGGITALYPSLFTFNATPHPLKALPGISVPMARVRIRQSKLEEEGPLLITHWGFSGPAVLKLSAWGALELAEKKYRFDLLIAWDKRYTEHYLQDKIQEYIQLHPKKKIINTPLDPLAKRLWEYLCEVADIQPEDTWNILSNKKKNKLIEQLMSYAVTITGKTTFKEEFVTAGGIALKDLDLATMESLHTPGLYAAGEVLNIDGITGGFNFQAAWTTAFIAAKNIVTSLNKSSNTKSDIHE